MQNGSFFPTWIHLNTNTFHPQMLSFKTSLVCDQTFTRFLNYKMSTKKPTTITIIRWPFTTNSTSKHISLQNCSKLKYWFHPFHFVIIPCCLCFETTFTCTQYTLAYSYSTREEDERSSRSLLVISGEKAKRVRQQVF